MDRRQPWPWYGWDPYWNQNQQPRPWNQNQQPRPWYGWDPYWNHHQGTSFSNVGRNGTVQQAGGRMRHSSSNSSRPPLGRPRPPQPQGGRVSLGGQGQSLNSSGQHRGRDLGRDGGKGVLGPDPSSQRVKTPPSLPPKKRAEFRSPELNSQHGNGSDDNSTEPPAKRPLDPPEKIPNPAPLSSTKTGLSSHVTTAVSAPAPLKSSDVDVSMTQRKNDQGDVLGLGGYIEKKRLLSKTSLADVEEEVKVTRKKTRLGWGQGLAKYEKQLIEQNGQKPGSSSNGKMTPSPPPGNNVDLHNNSTDMTEMIVSQVAMPASSRGSSPPTGDIGYRGSSSTRLTETVIQPAEGPDFSRKHNPPPAVGGSCDPCNSSSSMTETVVSELASSHGCDPLPAAGDTGGLGKRSTSLTETVISRAVPAFSHIHRTRPTPAVEGNSHISNSSMSMSKAIAYPASSHGYSVPSGAIGDHGNNSMSLTETVTRPADVPPPSQGCSSPPAVGDNSAHGNSSTSLTATVVNSDTVLASSDGCNLPPDGSNAKSTKVKDIPHKLISQWSNKIQKSARIPAIILRKLQKPKFQKNNILFEEPQTYELQGSRFKEWSQEEKDIFSEKITTFGMDFTRISSFLRHKTMTDCIEYYSKHYKSECSDKAKKCLPTMEQSQEKHTDENDAAPFMSGIATAIATKNYTRMKTVAEDTKKPVNQMCHEPMDHLQSHGLQDKGHLGQSSLEETEVVTGNVLVGEMNAPSPLGKSSPINNSGQAVRLVIPKTKVEDLKNLNEDSCSNEKIRGEQEILTDNERCRLIQAIEKHGKDFACMSVYVGTKSVQQCKNYLNKCKNDLDLANKHVTSSINSTTGTNDKSFSNIDSAICIAQSNSKVKENVSSQPVMNADHGDGENYLAGGSSAQDTSEILSLEILTDESCGHKLANGTIEGNQISSGEENPELRASSKECNDAAEHSWNDTEKKETNSNINDDSKAPSDMENPRSDNNPCIATNGAELSGHHEFVQPPEDSEAFKIGSKGNDDKAKRDEKNPQLCVSSKEGSGIQLGCNVSSPEKENVDIISSPEGNDLSAPPMQASGEACKNSHLSSSSGSAELQTTVYAKASRVEVDIDLDIPLDVAPTDMASVALDNNRAQASMDLNEPHQTTDAGEIMEHESGIIEARAATDLGGDGEAANDVTHVQSTTVPEANHQPANQPGCIRLFGQVIYQAPSPGTNHTSNQERNQIVVCSRDMPSNIAVPIRARGGQVYPSGSGIRRSAPLNPGQQAVLSNTSMPYRSTNGFAAWPPLQPGSSAVVNMSQQRHHVNMMPYNMMMRGGVPYHPRPGSSSNNNLINFNGFNPSQQQWPSSTLDTSRTVIGYPYLLGSIRNQAPRATMPSRINREATLSIQEQIERELIIRRLASRRSSNE